MSLALSCIQYAEPNLIRQIYYARDKRFELDLLRGVKILRACSAKPAQSSAGPAADLEVVVTPERKKSRRMSSIAAALVE